MSRTLGIALAQYPAKADFDIAEFATQLRTLTRLNPGMKLWAFPELFLDSPAAGAAPTARTLDDEAVSELGALARELGIWLVPGSMYERSDDGLIYNTAPVFSPDGARVAVYRKMFPWRPLETTTPGTSFELFDVPGVGRIGLSICYDIWFPEHTRHLAWLGADVVLNIVQTATGDRQQERSIVRGNAIMNQVWILSVNSSEPTGRGRSLAVDPDGAVRASSPDSGTEVLATVVDFEQTAAVRRFGTAGVSTPWSQLRDGDAEISLPLYDGSLTPSRWNNPPAS